MRNNRQRIYDTQISFRAPLDVKKKMQEIAKSNNRNLTAEIISCLRERIEREEFFAAIPEMTKIRVDND